MEHHEAPGTEHDPRVVTLCGSTRFEADFAAVDRRLTLQGYVVLSLETFRLPDPSSDDEAGRDELRARLAQVHRQKIRRADEVYVVDPGGYVGESTRGEIAYAESLGTPVRYLSREREEAHDDVREVGRT